MNIELYKDEALKVFKSFFADEEAYLTWLLRYQEDMSIEYETNGLQSIHIEVWKSEIRGDDGEDFGSHHSYDDVPARFIWYAPNLWVAYWIKNRMTHRSDKSGYSQPAVIVHHFTGEVEHQYWQNDVQTEPDQVKLK